MKTKNIMIRTLFIHVIFSLLFTGLSACDNSSNTNVTDSTKKASTELPPGLQKLPLNGGTLTAYITVDGNAANRTAMIIDSSGAGSASASIPGLSLAVHTLTITYEYTDSSGTMVLAQASGL